MPDVEGWRGIATVAVYGDRVVGIKSDGTVVEASLNGQSYTTDSIKPGRTHAFERGSILLCAKDISGRRIRALYSKLGCESYGGCPENGYSGL